MPEQNEVTRLHAAQGEPVEERGGLTGSGALQVVAEVVENPAVAAAFGATVGATVNHLLNRPKEPPQPPEPPHSGLWIPPGSEE
jgi:hypothetical protein